MDPETFQIAIDIKLEEIQRCKENGRHILDSKWNQIHSKLKSEDSEYEEPQVPFSPNAMIKDYNEIYANVADKIKTAN